MTAVPSPSLRHLSRLTNETGIYEHARLDEPRREFGYCTDDAGRLLVVASRLSHDPEARRLATVALRYLRRAHLGDGRFWLRLGTDGQWTDELSDDACGRAIYGLGVAAVHAPWPDVRAPARSLFARAAKFRSVHPRAAAYAILGAVAVLDAIPEHAEARSLLDQAANSLPHRTDDPRWPWPEPRLTYANAILPDALLAVAASRRDNHNLQRALELLDWLVAAEHRDQWFSFTPVGGRGPNDDQPDFDQQPIEAWAMAEACARAFAHTGDRRWADEVAQAAAWFTGENDSGVAMFDPATEGGFDGLERHGVNRNQGAESTLAFVGTMRQAHRIRAIVQATSSRRAAASESRR